ncbi:MAG: Maf family protein [Chitinispirillia bacterium]|jgi:septum formation protein
MLNWYNLDRSFVLASQSPRRKMILEKMGIAFDIFKPEIDDENRYLNSSNIRRSICDLAYAKVDSIAHKFHSSIILGCDTIVSINDMIIGKPENYYDAKKILETLSGKSHKVYTGIACVCREIDFRKSGIACTEVFFRDITDSEIDNYLANENYMDKAGAYAIQGKAMTFIHKINGCFYNVMGLPVYETINICKAYIKCMKGLK